jgi:hypothetical protein
MQPDAFRRAGEAMAALDGAAGARDWPQALARHLGLPLADIESYARGERRIPKEVGQRAGQVLEELGRRMSEPGRLLGQIAERNAPTGSSRSGEERQHGPQSPPEADGPGDRR